MNNTKKISTWLLILSLLLLVFLVPITFADSDIIISDVIIDESHVVNGKVFASAVLTNVGNVSVSGLFSTYFILNDDSISTAIVDIANLAVNESKTTDEIYFLLNSSTIYNISATTDYYNEIAEDNESNNNFVKIFNTSAPTYYDVSISPVSVFDSVAIGSTVQLNGVHTLSVTLTHTGTKANRVDGTLNFPELVSANGKKLIPSTSSLTFGLNRGQSTTYNVTYSGFTQNLLKEINTFNGNVSAHFNKEYNQNPQTKLMSVSISVDGNNAPLGFLIAQPNQVQSKTIGTDVITNDKLSYVYNITNTGVYNKDANVYANVSSLVLSTNNAITMPYDGSSYQVYVVSNGSTIPVTFRYVATSTVLQNPGTYTGTITFSDEFGQVTRTVQAVINSATGNMSTNTTINTTTTITSNFSNKLQIVVDTIRVDGTSDGTDSTIGSKEDLTFGSEVELKFYVKNLFNVDNDSTIIDGLSYELESDDIELVELSEGDIAEDVDGDDETDNVEITFKFPNAQDLDPSDLQDTYKLTLTVTGEDGNGKEHEAVQEFSLKLKRDTHSLQITDIKITPTNIACGDDSFIIEGTVKNFGTRDESDVTIRLYNSFISLDKTIELGDVDKEDEQTFKFTHTMPEIKGTVVSKFRWKQKQSLLQQKHFHTL
ncbi:MAG: CARDB domain-containing protein [Candidatus Woesearchaeota archaeon]|jgi:hypothetical protein